MSTFERELVKFNNEVVDLEAVLDDLVKVLQRSVRRLRDDLLKAHGLEVGREFGRQVKEVTLALSAATTCQNALRKTAKERASTMTAEQRREAVGRLVLNLPYQERRTFIANLAKAHCDKRKADLESGVETVDRSDIQVGLTLTRTLFVELS